MANALDSKFRRLLHNPNKILKPFIRKNMTVLDVGCGPGVFSVEIAKLMEGTGKIISADMQEGMLEIIRNKIRGTPFENRFVLHKCQPDRVGVSEKLDFVLMFYMVHEVPDRNSLFAEILPLINRDGLLMIAEPSLVSKKAFSAMINSVKEYGFSEECGIKISFGRGIVLKRTEVTE